MLNDREFSILTYLKQICSKGYTLVSSKSLLEYFKPDEVSTEQIGQTVIGLDEKGYLELKYFDGDEFLLRLLPPCFSAKRKEEKNEILPLQTSSIPNQEKKYISKIVFFAFLGSFLGSLLYAIIGVFLC